MEKSRINPRIQMTLPPELYKALKDLKAATGIAPSTFVGETLLPAIPSIYALIKAHKLAEEGKQEAVQVVEGELDRALEYAQQVDLDLRPKLKK